MVVRSRALVPLLATALVAGGLSLVAAQELNERCGGRSQQPTVPCQSDVTKMMAALAKVPAAPPATPQKPRKVLIWSRIPSAGFQHSSIPLAGKLIEELGKKTGAWTSDTAWDLSAMTAGNLAQ